MYNETELILDRDNLPYLLKSSNQYFSTEYEQNFNCLVLKTFALNNFHLAFIIVGLYLLFITIGSNIMKNYKPFDLTLLLALWNGFLCLFSFIGVIRTVPHMVSLLLTQTTQELLCSNPNEDYAQGVVGFWCMLFIASKIPELIDTVFIVLRKKPLIFLHWYHHVTVLLFCWHCYATSASSGLIFVTMNYSVHALMYGYYCLQALKMCPKWFPTILITLSQIAQMFVGTGVCISCWYYKLTDSCYTEKSNLIAGALMYGSYLYLFCDFAVRRFILKENKGTKKVKSV